MKRNDPVHALIDGHWHEAKFLCSCANGGGLGAVKVVIGCEEWTIRRTEVFTDQGKAQKRLELYEAEHKNIFDLLPTAKTQAALAEQLKISHSALVSIIRKRTRLRKSLKECEIGPT